MRLDDRMLGELITSRTTWQVDAMRTASAARPEITELHRLNPARRRSGCHRHLQRERRDCCATAAWASERWPPAVCSALPSARSARNRRPPAAAQDDRGRDDLPTASSLENLAVATYGAALELPFSGQCHRADLRRDHDAAAQGAR